MPEIFKYDLEATPLDSVYEAMRSKDLADCVAEATRVLKQLNNYMQFEVKEKSTSESLKHGVKGKQAFYEGEYQLALVSYNMALMRAPLNSEAMRLSYYSRAELLFKTKQFPACVKDIDTCLALDCPDSLVEKLQEMKAAASGFTWMEQVIRKEIFSPYTEEFFTLKGPRNPDIPCATSDVEVLMESGKPKVVAAKDIPVGTVVAIEKSFTTANHILNHITACHHCLKMDLNLTPCKGCCSAMFCDEQCKDKAMQEGHNVECKIIDFIMNTINLPVQAAIKIRQLCSSWDEFITASHDLGVERMKNSTIAEIFGCQKFSLLNSHHDSHFFYGSLFNRSMYFANAIHYLDKFTSFLPNSPEDKSAAIRAVSRVMMHLSLYCTPVQLQHYTSVRTNNLTILHNYTNSGYFPFIGNLTNSCLPNSYVAGLWNSAALVTMAPIKKGDELTFSYLGHWLEVLPSAPLMRAKKLFIHYRTVCKDCIICAGHTDKTLLNDTQAKAFKTFTAYCSDTMRKQFPPNIKSDYKEACNILLALSDAPCSKEYDKAYSTFIQCLMFCVQSKYPNAIMSRY